MSPQLIAGFVVVASIAAWAAFMAYTAFVPKRKTHGVSFPLPEPEIEGSTPATGAPGYVRELQVPEPAPVRRKRQDAQDISRRQFLNRAWGLSLMVSLAQFGMVSLDFLYPRLHGGLGAKITVGDVDEIKNELALRDPKFIPDGRFFLALYEGDPADAAKVAAYKAANVHQTGIMALYRKCVHLGCSVPWCPPAKWFECPCHGSKYSINGEYRDGPAPRSLDQFKVEIKGGKIIVDTATIIQGAPRGTTTSQPQPEGVHCVDIREG